MTAVTKRLTGTSDGTGDCTFDCTYDDVTHYVSSVRLHNQMAIPATLTITSNTDGSVWTFTAQPGDDITRNVPNRTFLEPRAYYPNPAPYSFALTV